MNSTLATEPAAVTDGKPTSLPPLENQSTNDRMRHVPPLEWMVQKIDSDVRKRIAKLMSVYTQSAAADPRHATVETELRALCKAIERLSDAVKPARHNNLPNDLASRMDTLLTQAAS